MRYSKLETFSIHRYVPNAGVSPDAVGDAGVNGTPGGATLQGLCNLSQWLNELTASNRMTLRPKMNASITKLRVKEYKMPELL
mmetsp:Transcript_25152/g.39804  ORF Transcript_25152/g.39804 Transcript_25152/m.39804 type:complete len:83 (-) Transcript_25152:67-315(-)